jgi:hypothetical protein
MKLTYTVEIDFGDDADITSEHQSAWLMQKAFEQVGHDIAGQTVHHLSIWAHEDSEPAADVDLRADDRDQPIPPKTCPTCGIQQFEKAAT